MPQYLFFHVCLELTVYKCYSNVFIITNIIIIYYLLLIGGSNYNFLKPMSMASLWLCVEYKHCGYVCNISYHFIIYLFFVLFYTLQQNITYNNFSGEFVTLLVRAFGVCAVPGKTNGNSTVDCLFKVQDVNVFLRKDSDHLVSTNFNSTL